MKVVRHMSGEDFRNLSSEGRKDLMRIVDDWDVIVVRGLFDPGLVRSLRDDAFQRGVTTEPAWHPCVDGCPDYHRLHDNYPKAHVKQKMHAFYRHGFYPENEQLFSQFSDVFRTKNQLSGLPADSYLNNRPSDGIIARVNIHHYPVGGGYQAEHIDPVAPFALIQTLVLASQYGVDYRSGGLYMSTDGTDRFYIDEHTEMGDMVVLSPGVRHGVAEVDPEKDYRWDENSGRWMILPIFIHSDVDASAPKPVQVS